MAVTLDSAKRADSAPALVEIERAKHGEREYAVADRSGEQVLCVVRERAVKDSAGKPTKEREQVLKPTAALADFADALACGLVA